MQGVTGPGCIVDVLHDLPKKRFSYHITAMKQRDMYGVVCRLTAGNRCESKHVIETLSGAMAFDPSSHV